MIIKAGIAKSPESRCLEFQRAIPEGAYLWRVLYSTIDAGWTSGVAPDAARDGETEMKRFLGANAKWLGGEFYLASEDQVEEAWRVGNEAALSSGEES